MLKMLKTIALKIPQIKAVVSQRDALLSERDRLNLAQGTASDRRVDESLVANLQLSDALKHANVLPIPPRHLQERVVGGYYPDFLSSATRSLSEFDAILKSASSTGLYGLDRVLDLGVGCGRLIRRFHELYPRSALTGADIDSEAIAWLQHNYARVGKFVALPHFPPSELEGDGFDLVYAVSVFTHLNEKMQFAWLGELQRITKIGGYLLLTVHGRHHQLRFPPDIQQKISGGFYYHEATPVTEGLPAFYKATFHTREYVEREWSRFFEILRYEEQGNEGHQDLILCRKR
jgi:SAM-dependent methyltransferase